jgi:hypothetical protein
VKSGEFHLFQSHKGLLLGDIYILPQTTRSPPVKCTQNGHGSAQPSIVLPKESGTFNRLPVEVRRTTRQEIARPTGMVSIKVVRFIVSIRTRLAKGGDGHHDQARIKLVKSMVTQPQFFQLVRGIILDENIGAGNQSLEDGSPSSRVKTESDPQLVTAEIKEQAGEVGVRHIMEEGASCPSLITDAGWFDFYYLGTEVS